MGCDIHIYIEYKPKKSDNSRYDNFGGRINPGRNYQLFGLLCRGIRSDNPQGIPQKLLPEYQTLGYKTCADNSLLITDDNEGDGCIKKETAECLVNEGSSKYVDERKISITHPDYHSHTWLSVEEYENQLKIYNGHTDNIKWKEPEYEAILAAMKKLAEFDSNVRLVFWFDN